MQSNPRIVVNLLVIAANILVHLLVKLAKLRVRGAIGAPGPGNTPGRGSYDLQLVHRDETRGYCTITKQPEDHQPITKL